MNIIYLALSISIICFIKCESNDSFLQIQKEISEFLHNETKPNFLQDEINKIFNIKNKISRNKEMCNLCVVFTNALLEFRRAGASRQRILEVLQKVCMEIVNKRQTCATFLNVQIDAGIYIVDSKPELTAEHFCSIRLQEFGCSDSKSKSWTITIPPRMEAYTLPTSNNTNEEYVLHLTDFHYDPFYEPGANTKCDSFICCQRVNGKATDSKNGAGYWGDYELCDTPLHSIHDLFNQIAKQHPRIDRVYFTGDIVSHQLWESSKETNANAIMKIINELKNTFKSTPVFPVLGNHEAHPTDMYSPSHITDEKFSSQWLLDLVAKEWSKWLPNDTQSTIKIGGYYTVLVRPGFRIIGMNSNLCYTNNLWLIYDDKDPHNQLQWLVDTLLAAEKKNELVHIISHVPPGDKNCLKQWNHEYRRIVDRFSHVIAGQFHGHTHRDQLKIFYGLNKPNQVVNVAFTGGSFVTYPGLNPTYRVYNIASGNWMVNDYDQWMYNLGEANKLQQAPIWFKLYSFRTAYGFDKLNLSAYHELIQRMAKNISLIEQYRRFEVRGSTGLLKKPCNTECLSDVLCSISTVELEDSIRCKGISSI